MVQNRDVVMTVNTVPNANAKLPLTGKSNLAALVVWDELAVVEDGGEVDDAAHGRGTPLY
jgi:hypothetical protein